MMVRVATWGIVTAMQHEGSVGRRWSIGEYPRNPVGAPAIKKTIAKLISARHPQPTGGPQNRMDRAILVDLLPETICLWSRLRSRLHGLLSSERSSWTGRPSSPTSRSLSCSSSASISSTRSAMSGSSRQRLFFHSCTVWNLPFLILYRRFVGRKVTRMFGTADDIELGYERLPGHK